MKKNKENTQKHKEIIEKLVKKYKSIEML